MESESSNDGGAVWARSAPRISVVIPAFNAAAFLAETLESISAQTLAPLETIVVDDGSTDDTVMIARSHGATVLSLSNGGPSAARNVGSNAARGDVLAFLDADDVWAPDKLAVQFAALAAYGKPAFSFTDYRIFDERGLHASPSELRRNAAFRRSARKLRGSGNVVIAGSTRHPSLRDSYIPPSSVLVRRADYIAAGGFDETLRVTEDYEFHLRLLRHVPAIGVMKPLLFYRRHAGQATAKAIVSKTGFFAVARLAAAAPHRYPEGDVRFLARTTFLRHYQLGMQQARLGEFDVAITSFEQSLADRWTVAAGVASAGARIARSRWGQAAFNAVRARWKRRRQRDSLVSN